MWCKDIFRCRMTMWIEHCIAGIPWMIYMDSLRRELLYPNTRSLRGWEHIGPSLISSVHILTSPGLSGVNMRMQSQSEYKLILLWVANISWGKIKINRPRQRSLDSINNATPYYTGNNTVLVKSVYSRVTKFNVTRIANISAIFSISGSFVEKHMYTCV